MIRLPYSDPTREVGSVNRQAERFLWQVTLLDTNGVRSDLGEIEVSEAFLE